MSLKSTDPGLSFTADSRPYGPMKVASWATPVGENRMILRSLVLSYYQRVTDRRKDRQTDERTRCLSRSLVLA